MQTDLCIANRNAVFAVFSLLVSGNPTAWETDQLMRVETERFKEYSPGGEAASISLDKPESLKALEECPALLMYERGGDAANADDVRYGFIQNLKIVRKELIFRFAEAGRLDRSDVEEFDDRLGINRFEHNRTHWAVKDGGVPSELLMRLHAIAPLISSATRNSFEDSYVRFAVLRDISRDFGEAGIEPGELEFREILVGQRRQLVQRYHKNVDWCSPSHAAQVVAAYTGHLARLRDRQIQDELERLLKHLRRDRARAVVPVIFSPIREFDVVVGDSTKTLTDTISAVGSSFDQAFEHLNQALEHLRAPQSNRSRKDGLRDCLSAMESLLKAATDTKDIKEATSALRHSKEWGNDRIVKEGLTIWNHVHELYPDVRHGQATSSELGTCRVHVLG
jgi:hypothetical protein